MRFRVALFSCGLCFCAAAWLCAEPVKPVPVAVMEIHDTAALRAQEGKVVMVSGIVSRVGASKSGSIWFINFEGVIPGGFTAVVKSDSLPEIERAVGANLDAALPGRKASVTGRITLYKETPQIAITAADQIKVAR